MKKTEVDLNWDINEQKYSEKREDIDKDINIKKDLEKYFKFLDDIVQYAPFSKKEKTADKQFTLE